MKKGDRVKEPSNEYVIGTIIGDPLRDGTVTVRWDDGHSRITNIQLLELVEEGEGNE